jgi:hypothetical protein
MDLPRQVLGEAQISFGFQTRVTALAAAIIAIGERCHQKKSSL